MNCIFDLYGTLVDIRTDEADPRLWRVMADLYRRYGAVYGPAELHNRFLKIERRMRQETAALLSTSTPEIKLERVFQELLREAVQPVSGEEHTDNMASWLYGIANTFRALSIKKIRLFPGVPALLRRLRKDGHKIYLLSNAQAIFTIPEIEYLGLSACFDAMYLSSDHHRCKPDPHFLETLLREQDLYRDETVMIGNEPGSDMGIAALCGVSGILVNLCQLPEETIQEQLRKAAPEKADAFLPHMRVISQIGELTL